MTHHRRLIVAAAAAGALGAGLRQADAQTDDKADFLFVQTARRMSFDRATNTLSLHEVSPITLFFADRPDRIAGNMRTTAFIPFWSQGTNSFLSDPPNADLSILEGDQLRQVVVVLRTPVLEGDTLRYTVQVLDGQMPAAGNDVSLFIDVIGMPLTPLSFAGARRRAWRRAALYR